MPMLALADTEVVNGITWWYTVEGGEAWIFTDPRTPAIPSETTGPITVPSTLGGCPVTSIGDGAFRGCSGLTSVTIPSSVTSIGEWAFYDCSGLTSVTIPSSVTSIGEWAFYDCDGLTSVTIPSSVTSIGGWAFSGCSGLTSVTIPASVTSIGVWAFGGCSGLASVMIPSSVTSVGEGAFNSCSGLKSVTISQGVKGIDVKAFLDCRSISSVTLPANFKVEDVFPDSKDAITDVTILGDGSALCDYAYLDCRLLENVTFNGAFTEIGESAFENCRHIETICIPDGVTEIGRYAFAGCSGLISIMIPKSVTSVGRHAFDECDDLETIIVGAGDAERVKAVLEAGHVDTDYFTFAEVCVISFDANGGTPVPADVLCGKGTRYGELPTVTRKGYSFDGWYTALEGGTKVDSMTIASGDATLFAHWTAFPVYRIVLNPGNGQVEWTTKEVFAGDAVGALPVAVQEGYEFLGWFTDETGGEQVTELGVLTADVTLYAHYAVFPTYVVKDGTLVKYTGKGADAVVPDGVTCIGSGAFSGCSWLTSVTIPASVMSIGDAAFEGCDALTTVHLVSGDTERIKTMIVGSNSGIDVDSLTFVEPLFDGGPYTEMVDGIAWLFMIENGMARVGWDGYELAISSETVGAITIPSTLGGCPVTSIEECAFYGCSGLTSVTIPEGVTSIERCAFSGCNGLTSVAIPSSVTSIEGYAFLGCNGLTSVTLPAKFASIGTLFPDAKGIKSVTWFDDGSKASVSPGSCSGLENLERVVIPADVMNVEDRAFCNCHKLKSVIFEGNAPDVGTEVFNGTPKDLVLSVPAGSVGWDGGFTSTALPSTWGGRAIAHIGESYDWSRGTTAPAAAVAGGSVTVSNVVVHYILNSVQPEFAIQPADDMNFVNIITEVKGNTAVAIPETWAASYPGFAEKFGTDFTQALLKPSGKIGTGGTPMLVWQDYVAGTDPTDEKDVFTASITIVDGKVTISYTPELDDARKAMRKYTTWGKTSLMDTDWTEVQEGHEAEFNFFKVSVEMR